MAVLRYFAVAASFGQPPDKLEALVSGTWLAANPESAAAGIVSKHYFDGSPRHACLGVSVWEITPEAMTHALQQIAEAEKAGAAAVVPFLVVPNTGAPTEVPVRPTTPPSCIQDGNHDWEDTLGKGGFSGTFLRICRKCGTTVDAAPG